jgi:hypothetical protein
VYLLAAAALFAAPAARASMIFSATLSGANEVPPNASSATGFAIVTLQDDMTTIDVTSMAWSNLTAPATAAHIHCCVPPGATAPVVLPFTGFPALTTGTYSNRFSIPAQLTGGISYQAFLTGLESGQAYVNIHNVNFPGGEIRGWLTAAAAPVPEPATFGLGALALIGMAALRRRVHRRGAETQRNT